MCFSILIPAYLHLTFYHVGLIRGLLCPTVVKMELDLECGNKPKKLILDVVVYGDQNLNSTKYMSLKLYQSNLLVERTSDVHVLILLYKTVAHPVSLNLLHLL